MKMTKEDLQLAIGLAQFIFGISVSQESLQTIYRVFGLKDEKSHKRN